MLGWVEWYVLCGLKKVLLLSLAPAVLSFRFFPTTLTLSTVFCVCSFVCYPDASISLPSVLGSAAYCLPVFVLTRVFASPSSNIPPYFIPQDFNEERNICFTSSFPRLEKLCTQVYVWHFLDHCLRLVPVVIWCIILQLPFGCCAVVLHLWIPYLKEKPLRELSHVGHRFRCDCCHVWGSWILSSFSLSFSFLPSPSLNSAACSLLPWTCAGA